LYFSSLDDSGLGKELVGVDDSMWFGQGAKKDGKKNGQDGITKE
jgi:hypothetical protein